MKPPVCRVCLSAHFGAAHVFKGSVPEPSELCRPKVVNKPQVVVNSGPVVVNRNHDRHKNAEARKTYMRDYMRKRRAKSGVVEVSTDTGVQDTEVSQAGSG